MILLFLVAAGGATALGIYVQSGHDKVPPAEPAPKPQITRPVEKPIEHKEQNPTVMVLVPSSKGENLTFKEDNRPLPLGEDAKVYSINEYLRQLPSVPKDAKALSVEISNRTAVVQFNKAFTDASYGSMDEKFVLDGVCATMGEFPDIDQVMFQFDGKPIDSLGHADLTDPLPVIHVGETPNPVP